MRSRLTVFLVLVICLGVVFSSVTYYALSPRPSQPFMGIGVLSRNGFLDYLPASNSTVSTHQMMNWTISITNRMGSAQFAMIIVRLENSTLPSPTTSTPSNITLSEIATPESFIADGDTFNTTFTWTINSTTQSSGLEFLNLTVNGQPAANAASVGAVRGEGFRWVFELWTYDLTCGSPLSNGCFHYGYGPQTSPEGSWLQVWFNVSP